MLELTLVGYLLVSIWVAYSVGVYAFSSDVLGWWLPSGEREDPNALATWWPWLPVIARSAFAGTWEECVFRAFPLAGAALVGQFFERRRSFVAVALVLQALFFGAAHANYAQQPAFARVAELMLPSIGLGLVYITLGLGVAVLLHFSYDVVAFALPIFVSSAPGAVLHQAIVVWMVLLPLQVVLFARWRRGAWGEVPREAMNDRWVKPPEIGLADGPFEHERE